MRVLTAFTIIFFAFISLTKADDIRDFEIEGISIGDSALDFFTKEKILKNKYFAYELKDYFQSWSKIESEQYNNIQFSIKNNDNNFIIESIEAGIAPINFNDCKEQKKIIEKEIVELFPNLVVDYGKEGNMFDNTGRVITTDIYMNKFWNTGGMIRIMCVDRSKKIEEERGWVDNLRVIVNSKEFNIFIDKNAKLKQ